MTGRVSFAGTHLKFRAGFPSKSNTPHEEDGGEAPYLRNECISVDIDVWDRGLPYRQIYRRPGSPDPEPGCARSLRLLWDLPAKLRGTILATLPRRQSC